MKGKTGFALAVALATAPMASTQAARRTDFQNLKGQAVESLLRYGFDAMWALDEQNLLLRDTFRHYYLVGFDARCEWIDRPESVTFVPALQGRVRASLPYEARDTAGRICEIASVRQVVSRDEARSLAGVG